MWQSNAGKFAEVMVKLWVRTDENNVNFYENLGKRFFETYINLEFANTSREGLKLE